MVRIYHKGCLCCWREDRCLLFTRRLSEGCTADYVQQVVDALLERGFFSKA
ncbi:Lin1244/Lin1753 domain-containing protein [Phocaeicola vulgatus]